MFMELGHCCFAYAKFRAQPSRHQFRASSKMSKTRNAAGVCCAQVKNDLAEAMKARFPEQLREAGDVLASTMSAESPNLNSAGFKPSGDV